MNGSDCRHGRPVGADHRCHVCDFEKRLAQCVLNNIATAAPVGMRPLVTSEVMKVLDVLVANNDRLPISGAAP